MLTRSTENAPVKDVQSPFGPSDQRRPSPVQAVDSSIVSCYLRLGKKGHAFCPGFSLKGSKLRLSRVAIPSVSIFARQVYSQGC